jgi:hypothetical protein
MCRYALKPDYKKHYACFRCRKAFKRRNKVDVDPLGDEHPARCPQCGMLMADMGLDFAPPKTSNVKAWHTAATLFEVGETFHSCGCGGPGYRPKDPAKLAAFFADRLREYQAQLAGWTRDTTKARAANRKSAMAHWRSRIAALEAARSN